MNAAPASSVAKKCPEREILSHSLSPETMRVSEIEFSVSGNTGCVSSHLAVVSRPHIGERMEEFEVLVARLRLPF